MKILVLNGSPKGERSNTYKITMAFCDGLNAVEDHSVDIVDISKTRIQPCLGCFSCWSSTPGHCVIKDDMAEIMERYTKADLVIWSFPLYCFGMPSGIKACLDRLLPGCLPAINVTPDGTNSHPSRYDMSHQRHVLISTCGFYSIKNNYEALFKQFEIMFGDNLTRIICPEGELLRVPELAKRTDEYLSFAKEAGKEYAQQGTFSPVTQHRLEELLFPPKTYLEMSNAEWEIRQADNTADISHPFMRQMAALYHPDMYKKDIILEMYFTDLDKTYQLIMGKETCQVMTESSLPFTTRIETSFDLWTQISAGKINGAEAMMKQQYKVLGDLGFMMKLDSFFSMKPETRPDTFNASGTESTIKTNKVSAVKPSNMLLLLLPFMALWILMPVNASLGAAAAILISAFVSYLHTWWKPTPYEKTGTCIVTIIGLYTLISGYDPWQLALPSFASAVLWLNSSCRKIPLTAYYSCKDYGEESAFQIPLFIQTNRILTTLWGVAYLIWGVAQLTLANTANDSIFSITIWICTALLGVFTAWFSKWYPSKVAAGN